MPVKSTFSASFLSQTIAKGFSFNIYIYNLVVVVGCWLLVVVCGLFVWLVDWLVGCLVGWLVGLVGWLVVWLVGWLFGWLVGLVGLVVVVVVVGFMADVTWQNYIWGPAGAACRRVQACSERASTRLARPYWWNGRWLSFRAINGFLTTKKCRNIRNSWKT